MATDYGHQLWLPIIPPLHHGSHLVPHGSAVAVQALVINKVRLPIEPINRPWIHM